MPNSPFEDFPPLEHRNSMEKNFNASALTTIMDRDDEGIYIWVLLLTVTISNVLNLYI